MFYLVYKVQSKIEKITIINDERTYNSKSIENYGTPIRSLKTKQITPVQIENKRQLKIIPEDALFQPVGTSYYKI